MIRLSDSELTFLMEAGFVSLRLGRFREAYEIFEGVAAFEPTSEVPLVAIGTVSFGQFKFDQAIRWYKKALSLKPNSAFARVYLGESLFFKGEKEKAVQELEAASSLDPKGSSGDFARALLTLIKSGFVPPGQVKAKA